MKTKHTMVRINPEDRLILMKLAKRDDRSMTSIVSILIRKKARELGIK